jgi:hypothetical protein
MFMSRTIHGALALLAAATIAVSAPASASPGTDLTAQQDASLRALGIRVAVVTYIPAGYAIEDVTITPCAHRARRAGNGTCSEGPDYILRYYKGSSWFAIEGTGGGLGETRLTYKTFVKTQIFGTVPLRFGPGPDGIGLPPSAAQLRAAQNEVYCDWLASGPSGPFYHVIGERIAPDVMSKILASMVWQPSDR